MPNLLDTLRPFTVTEPISTPITTMADKTTDKPKAEPIAPSIPEPEATQETKEHLWPFQEDLTVSEGQMIRAFRIWTRAGEDEEFNRQMQTFETLQTFVIDYLDGRFSKQDAVFAVGENRAPRLLSALAIIAELYPVFDMRLPDAELPPIAPTKKKAKKAKKKAKVLAASPAPEPITAAAPTTQEKQYRRISHTQPSGSSTEVSDGEHFLIEFQRMLTKTDTDPDAFADFELWQLLKIEADELMAGRTACHLDVADYPELHRVAAEIANLMRFTRARLMEKHGDLMPLPIQEEEAK